jgi:hypothetical protein
MGFARSALALRAFNTGDAAHVLDVVNADLIEGQRWAAGGRGPGGAGLAVIRDTVFRRWRSIGTATLDCGWRQVPRR